MREKVKIERGRKCERTRGRERECVRELGGRGRKRGRVGERGR